MRSAGGKNHLIFSVKFKQYFHILDNFASGGVTTGCTDIGPLVLSKQMLYWLGAHPVSSSFFSETSKVVPEGALIAMRVDSRFLMSSWVTKANFWFSSAPSCSKQSFISVRLRSTSSSCCLASASSSCSLMSWRPCWSYWLMPSAFLLKIVARIWRICLNLT